MIKGFTSIYSVLNRKRDVNEDWRGGNFNTFTYYFSESVYGKIDDYHFKGTSVLVIVQTNVESFIRQKSDTVS